MKFLYLPLRIFSALFFLLLFFSACKEKKSTPPKTTSDSTFTFKKEGEVTFFKTDSAVVKRIDIEIAETDAERQQGLMNRPWMEETQGMIFIFDRNEPQSFWMRNTIIPLDLIFINENFVIGHIAENAQPFSEKGIPSRGNAKYVVETVAGFCEKYGIAPGDFITFKRSAS